LLILQLDKSIRHLNSDAAHKQLEVHISEYLQRKVTVELNIVEKTVADPYQIQSDINAKRYEYAKQVLAEDEIVIALQQQFQAELDQETVVAR
jgi:DNA polymerase-3 subunit gamma/tau